MECAPILPSALRLCLLFAVHSKLLTPVLRIIHRVIAGFLRKQSGLQRTKAEQRFGSVANLNTHLHCLVLDGVYRHTGGEPVFQAARPPSGAELQGLLDRSIARLLKLLTRQRYLVEKQGVTYVNADNALVALLTGVVPRYCLTYRQLRREA